MKIFVINFFVLHIVGAQGKECSHTSVNSSGIVVDNYGYEGSVRGPMHKLLTEVQKYETAYACEGNTLTIGCQAGHLIHLLRANYGRFSIAICNDHDDGNFDMNIKCMSPMGFWVLHSKCARKQNCSVLVSSNTFGDPCPDTHKYIEAHYKCVSVTQSAAKIPPWLVKFQSMIRVPKPKTQDQIYTKYNRILKD